MRLISKTPDKKKSIHECERGNRYKVEFDKSTPQLNKSKGDILAIKMKCQYIDTEDNPKIMSDGSTLEYAKVFVINQGALDSGDYTLEEKLDEFHNELAEELADRNEVLNAFKLWDNLGA